jgi:hypothetical protein
MGCRDSVVSPGIGDRGGGSVYGSCAGWGYRAGPFCQTAARWSQGCLAEVPELERSTDLRHNGVDVNVSRGLSSGLVFDVGRPGGGQEVVGRAVSAIAHASREVVARRPEPEQGDGVIEPSPVARVVN